MTGEICKLSIKFMTKIRSTWSDKMSRYRILSYRQNSKRQCYKIQAFLKNKDIPITQKHHMFHFLNSIHVYKKHWLFILFILFLLYLKFNFQVFRISLNSIIIFIIIHKKYDNIHSYITCVLYIIIYSRQAHILMAYKNDNTFSNTKTKQKPTITLT